MQIAGRTVTDQLYRYEELLALSLADPKRLQERLGGQGQVILALDGLQPDVGHEVLWVLRDCCSGEVLLARSLLGATEQYLVPLLEEVASVCQALQVPIKGVISDGQHSVRNAVTSGLTDHVWSVGELLSYKVAPSLWVEPKRRGRPKKQAEQTGIAAKCQKPRSRLRPLVRLGKGVLCSTTS